MLSIQLSHREIWSAATTWGVAAPAFNNTLDQIIIPAGITVTMDNNASINGAPASLTVNGTLTSNAASTLTIGQGSVTGNGAINVGTLALNAASMLAFTGTVTAEYVNSASTGIQGAATFVVSKALNLTGGTFTLANGGSLSVANGSTITFSGGMMALNGGTLSLINQYSVR
ncbi:MAG: hypothetical protein SGJ05_05290 [bacterium]|nr:hypothetical protein [bacterium]